MHNPGGLGKAMAGDSKLFRKFIAIDQRIKSANFNEILSDDFFKEVDRFAADAAAHYRAIGVDALIVPNDIVFFEQLNIKILEKLEKPSFVFLHGLPSRYNRYDENQADYLIVWGKKIKQNYVNAGVDPEKIIVSGHPFYEKLSSGPLRYGLDDILIISKSLNGSQQRDGVRLIDRGNLIIYLEGVKNVLKSIGVKNVRLRVHPSESIDWYFKFIDRDFFIADSSPLQDSLRRATLVIGPTSTVFLESIYYGVNYLVYEPTSQNIDLSGFPLVPPFDGSDPKVAVAKNEAELRQLLKGKTVLDKTVFNDYIETPFNPRVFTDLI
ncbi:MAG: hypothetical protein WCF77_04380 [Minisyncoccia bacterium]